MNRRHPAGKGMNLNQWGASSYIVIKYSDSTYEYMACADGRERESAAQYDAELIEICGTVEKAKRTCELLNAQNIVV